MRFWDICFWSYFVVGHILVISLVIILGSYFTKSGHAFAWGPPKAHLWATILHSLLHCNGAGLGLVGFGSCVKKPIIIACLAFERCIIICRHIVESTCMYVWQCSMVLPTQMNIPVMLSTCCPVNPDPWWTSTFMYSYVACWWKVVSTCVERRVW